jgi:hypothetical protein
MANRGGDNGLAIVPGDPEKSLPIRAVRHTDRLTFRETNANRNPASGKLT